METLHSCGSEKPDPRIKELLKWIIAIILFLGTVALIETHYIAR